MPENEAVVGAHDPGSAAPVRPQGRGYYPALDGLRAVSFFAVFFWHYLGLPYGWTGVDVFFVLSGFLITGILFDSQDEPHRARNFYIRRTLRIFPLYYGVFLAIYLATPLMHWQWTWQWLAWPLYLGNFLRFLYPHTNNYFVATFSDGLLSSTSGFLGRGFGAYIPLGLGHFWTLCVEEQFYLIWPWVIFAVRDRRKLIAICTFWIVVLPIVRSISATLLPQALVEGSILFHATCFRFDTLLVGAVIALIYRGSHRGLMQKIAKPILALGVLCVAGIIVSHFVFHSTKVFDLVGLHSWMLSIVAVFDGALLLRTLVPGTIAYRVLNTGWLRSVGRISYGAYVFHEIPINILTRLVERHVTRNAEWWTAALGLILTLGLAALSYRYFEAPILRQKGRLTSRA